MKAASLFSVPLFLFFTICLNAQNENTIKITGKTIACKGDSLELTATATGIVPSNYIWSSDKGNINTTGKKIKLLVDEKLFADSFLVYLQAYAESDSIVSTFQDSMKIFIGQKPTFEGDIKSFQRENSIFLEVKESEGQKYEWKNASGTPAKGNIVKFIDPKLSETKDYKLIITDVKSGCTTEKKHTIKDDDDKDGNIFGSIDDNEIPSELYKEVQRDIPIYECDILGNNKSTNFKVLGRGIRFTIIGEIEDDYIIRVWKWEPDKDPKNKKFVIKDIEKETKLENFLYFRVDKGKVSARGISIVPNRLSQNWSFTAGTVIIPIKVRKSNTLNKDDNKFEFSKDVALGPFVGLKKRLSRHKPIFLSLGMTVGISSVRLTANNSDSTRTTTVQDLAALTMAGGAVIEVDNVQFGFFIGTDRINNNFDTDREKGYNWIYQNKPWVSIGFGYELVRRPEKKANISPGNLKN